MKLRKLLTSSGMAARLAGALIVGLLALGLVACGGSDSKASPEESSSSNSSSDSTQDRNRLRLQECLRKQGVDVPEPGQGGGGNPPDREKLQAALEGACKKYQQGAFGNLSEEDRAEQRDRLTKFTSCMRENGVDIPDFEPGSGPPPTRIDQDDPAVQKATKACQDQLPQGGPGGPGPGGGGGD